MPITAPAPSDIFAVALTAISEGNTQLIILGIFLGAFILTFILSGKKLIPSVFVALGLALVYSLYTIIQYSSNIVY